MKCACGAEYEVYDHGNGYIIRCKNWRKHRVIDLGIPKNETMEEYDKAMEAITEDSLSLWHEDENK